MGKTTSTIPFNGSAEQEAKLMEVIAEHKSDKGALMPILQQAQEIYGYLPIEVQEIIAKEMDIPLEKIYGVVTFYSQFSLNPKGKYTISVCLGTACYVKGSGDIFNKLSEILGIKDLRSDKRIDFVGGLRGLGELKRRVDSGEMRMALALYPVTMKQIMDIADSGKIMPPKATWFEPKLRSGLVIHKLS